MTEEKKEYSELEEEFRKAYEEATEKINAELKIASDAIRRAERISEETGIPFEANVSPLSRRYCPRSSSKIWGEIDKEMIDELTDGEMYSLENEYGTGWEHSAVC